MFINLCILNVRYQEAIIDKIGAMIDCWILANCYNDATFDVKITHVLVNEINETCEACVNLYHLLIKTRQCLFINTLHKRTEISLNKHSRLT